MIRRMVRNEVVMPQGTVFDLSTTAILFDPHLASASHWREVHRYRRRQHEEWGLRSEAPSDAEYECFVRARYNAGSYMQWLARECDMVVGSIDIYCAAGDAIPGANPSKASLIGYVLNAYRKRGHGRGLLKAVCSGAPDFVTAFDVLVTDEDGVRLMERAGGILHERWIKSRLIFKSIDRDILRAISTTALEAQVNVQLGVYGPHIEPTISRKIQPLYHRLAREALKDAGTLVERRSARNPAERGNAAEDETYRVVAVVWHGDVEPIAFSEARWRPRKDKVATHTLTGVSSSWRGRGLAKAAKAALVCDLGQRFPELDGVISVNAARNGPIRAVNAHLGFVASQYTSTYSVARGTLNANMST
jgi:GNAT superfamily N-acetyltransferase